MQLKYRNTKTGFKYLTIHIYWDCTVFPLFILFSISQQVAEKGKHFEYDVVVILFHF